MSTDEVTPTNGGSQEEEGGKGTDENSKSSQKKETETTITKSHTSQKETMDDDDDDTEKKLGILQYVTSTDGFSAVVKGRYSDFLVHEVDLDGNIARLTDREVPTGIKDKNDDGTKEDDGDTAKTTTTDTPSKVQERKNWPTLEKELNEMIHNEDITKEVLAMLQAHNQRRECEEKYVTLPALEKEQRKEVHHWIRNSLFCARADTHEGCIRIWHASFEREMPNFKTFGSAQKNRNNKRQKQSWPSDRPNFLQFVLYKENMDTTVATKDLSRRGCKARIGFAGMKDKRGITTQFCTLYRTEPQQIVSHSQQQRGGGGNTKNKGQSVVQVGNFKYVSREIKLGTLRGNRFDIVMRNVQTGKTSGDNHDVAELVDRSILEAAAKAMREKGFINYFGTQRFGKYNNTHLVGIEILKGNYRKATDIIMEPKPDDRPDAAKGREDWKNRFEKGETPENEVESAKRVIRTLNRFMTAENSLMQSLSRKPMDYQKAFSSIPKTLRMMFLHAVQSLIWNQAASYRIASMNRDEVLVGDLVQTSSSDNHDAHIVTEEDIANKRFTVEDIVVPLVGTKSKLPTNELGTVIEKLFDDIGVTTSMFKSVHNKDKDLAVRGDYRKLMCCPKDVDFEIKEYFDPFQPLLETDLMKLNNEKIEIVPKKDDEEKVKVAMLVGFTLPSSAYATIALRELMKRPTSNEYQKNLKL